MNDIKGPKLSVQISPLLALEDSDDIATAIFRLKNYPGESIDISKLRETVNTKRIVHLSQTQEEETYDAMFNDLADELRVGISGPVSYSVHPYQMLNLPLEIILHHVWHVNLSSNYGKRAALLQTILVLLE